MCNTAYDWINIIWDSDVENCKYEEKTINIVCYNNISVRHTNIHAFE